MSKQHFTSIFILTGAGISAESGIKTFRDHNGQWESNSIEEVASLQGFETNPTIVNRFYNQRRAQLADPAVQPNAAHIALAKLEASWRGEFLLVTQNVDDLHERAGSKNLIHMHGELRKARCLKVKCRRDSRQLEWSNDILPDLFCESCCSTHELRPDIVWFGENPRELSRIYSALKTCDLFIAIGTSGVVHPAAGFVQEVPPSCRTIEVNPTQTDVSGQFNELRMGPSSISVPQLVGELLS